MRRRINYKYMMSLIILFVGIGFALISSNLGITGIGNFKNNSWEIYFDNLVDDSLDTTVSVPATISNDKATIEFNVNLNEPGANYMFYTDIVNNGTIDAMFDSITIEGLTEQDSQYIKVNITYNDGVEFTKYDLLRANSRDTLKIEALYTDNINPEDLPTEGGNIALTATINYVQADSNAKERNHNADVEGPVIRFINSPITGKNGWSNALIVTTKVIDVSSIDSVKYCISTNECIPNTTTSLTNNTFRYTFESNSNNQVLCVEAIDSEENTTTKCSKDEYLVDGDDPLVTNVTVTPDDDTMLIQITGSDATSGPSKYYYSKDGGLTYTSSTNSNYTFTSLDNGDYIIMVYIEDTAGNISNKETVTTTIRHKSWCEKNNIDNLGDCAIAMDTGITNIETAKATIKAKATPDFSKTAPDYEYSEKVSNGITVYTTDDKYVYIGDEYSFNKETGLFTINNFNKVLLSTIDYDFERKNYFICDILTARSNCSSIYKISSIFKATSKYNIYKYDITMEISSYNTTESGMFTAIDEDNKDSFYYRGMVGGNFVKFADMYWKIVRINGDGNIRLMYFSDTDTITGKYVTSTKINEKYWDPTYVGFMYNDEDFSNSEIESAGASFDNFDENTNYYFSKSYTYDASSKKFFLTGNVDDMIYGTWKDKYALLLPSNDEYYYSCFSTTETAACPVLLKITGYRNNTAANVHYLSYSSISYENSVKNKSNSSILEALNLWFERNIYGKEDDYGNLYSNYIADSIFCNDRSLSPINGNGNGFSFYPTTFYGAYYRLYDTKNPSLVCQNENDKFTSTFSDKGNKMLLYPIGLLTADEVALAGGSQRKVNPLYFMNYDNATYIWTLSPSYFGSWEGIGHYWPISKNGSLTTGASINTNYYKLRPVLNLDSSKVKFTGDGTAENPFIVEMK